MIRFKLAEHCKVGLCTGTLKTNQHGPGMTTIKPRFFAFKWVKPDVTPPTWGRRLLIYFPDATVRSFDIYIDRR